MFKRKIIRKIDDLNKKLEQSRIFEVSYIIGSKREIIKRNLIAGIARGVGAGIGITIVSAVIIIILRRIITLNIPIIGDYIADIVSIVQKNL